MSGNKTKDNVIVITDELRALIDQNRGNLSRAEFIDLCVSSFLESRTWVYPRREIPVPAPIIEQKPLPPPCPPRVPEKPEVPVSVEEELPNHYFKALWAIAVLTYGIGDLLTTYLAIWVFDIGLEINPIMAFFGNPISMFFFKVATLIAVFLVSWAFRHHKGFYYSVPIITAVVGAILTVNNLAKLPIW